MDRPPFPEAHQLNEQLEVRVSKAPGEALELRRTDAKLNTLPGQPRIPLEGCKLLDHLREELLVPQLDQIASKLWLVSTPRSSHISALHHQAVRGRAILITENPHLHLVWYYEKIFIKPVPRYMLSYAFWRYLATQAEELQQAAIGFMRTYFYLIRHETDFCLAIEKNLIPQTTDDGKTLICWETFATLIASFEQFDDETVLPRYGYGELRLTRLNFYSRIFLGKLTYHHIEAQWGPFLSSFLSPFIVVFVVLTLVLNAMQVALTAQGFQNTDPQWQAFVRFSTTFSVITLSFAAVVTAIVFIIVVVMSLHDLYFARRILSEKKCSANQAWKTRKSGVV